MRNCIYIPRVFPGHFKPTTSSELQATPFMFSLNGQLSKELSLPRQPKVVYLKTGTTLLMSNEYGKASSPYLSENP